MQNLCASKLKNALNLYPDIFSLFFQNNIHLMYTEKYLDAGRNDLKAKPQKLE
jgi:hypothetical protein